MVNPRALHLENLEKNPEEKPCKKPHTLDNNRSKSESKK
jgi:hypothetical protein